MDTPDITPNPQNPVWTPEDPNENDFDGAVAALDAVVVFADRTKPQ